MSTVAAEVSYQELNGLGVLVNANITVYSDDYPALLSVAAEGVWYQEDVDTDRLIPTARLIAVSRPH